MTTKRALYLLLKKLAQESKKSPSKHGGTVTAIAVIVQIAMVTIFAFIGYGLVMVPLESIHAAEVIGRDWIWLVIIDVSLIIWANIMWRTTWCERWFFIVKPQFGVVGSWLLFNGKQKFNDGNVSIADSTRNLRQFLPGWHGAIPGAFKLFAGFNLNGIIAIGQSAEEQPLKVYTSEADKKRIVLFKWNGNLRPLANHLCELACQNTIQATQFFENIIDQVGRDWCTTHKEEEVFAGLSSQGKLSKAMIDEFKGYQVADEREQQRGLRLDDLTVPFLDRDKTQEEISARQQQVKEVESAIKTITGALTPDQQQRTDPGLIVVTANGLVRGQEFQPIVTIGGGTTGNSSGKSSIAEDEAIMSALEKTDTKKAGRKGKAKK